MNQPLIDKVEGTEPGKTSNKSTSSSCVTTTYKTSLITAFNITETNNNNNRRTLPKNSRDALSHIPDDKGSGDSDDDPNDNGGGGKPDGPDDRRPDNLDNDDFFADSEDDGPEETARDDPDCSEKDDDEPEGAVNDDADGSEKADQDEAAASDKDAHTGAGGDDAAGHDEASVDDQPMSLLDETSGDGEPACPGDDESTGVGDSEAAGSGDGEFTGFGNNEPSGSGFEQDTDGQDDQFAYTGSHGLDRPGDDGQGIGPTRLRCTPVDVQSDSGLLTNISDEIRRVRKLKNRLKEKEEKRRRAEEKSKKSSIIYNPDRKPVLEYARTRSMPSTARVGEGGGGNASYSGHIVAKRTEDVHESTRDQLRDAVNDQSILARVAKRGRQEIASRLQHMGAGTTQTLPTPLVKQIIVYEPENNEYRIRSPETWPAIVNKRSKLIAVAGMKQSGRTTLLHSIIYEYGYALTESQAMASRIGVGVIMYVLEQPGVIILDIADSMDNGSPSAPLGLALLELFGYINCDHILYNMQIDVAEEILAEGYLISWLEDRIRILFESALLVGLYGASKISIVLRPGSPDRNGNERVEKVISTFINTVTEDANVIAQMNASKERDGEEPSQEQPKQPVEITSKYLRTVMHNVAAFRLPYLEPDALSAWEAYNDALKPIHDRLETQTAYHATADFQYEQVHDGPRTIIDTMVRAWNALQRSESLQKTFTAAATQSRETNEEPDKTVSNLGDSMKGYVDEVQKMLKTLSVDSECATLLGDLKRLDDDLKSQVESEQHLKEEDRNQFTFLRYILETATTIIGAAREFTALSSKELALRVGLRGITCVIRQMGLQ